MHWSNVHGIIARCNVSRSRATPETSASGQDCHSWATTCSISILLHCPLPLAAARVVAGKTTTMKNTPYLLVIPISMAMAMHQQYNYNYNSTYANNPMVGFQGFLGSSHRPPPSGEYVLQEYKQQSIGHTITMPVFVTFHHQLVDKRHKVEGS